MCSFQRENTKFEKIPRFFSSILLIVGFLTIVRSELPDQTTMFALNEEIGVQGWGVNSSDYCNWRGIVCSSNQTVEVLDLSSRWLRGNVTLISDLKALKWLDLSNNYFSGPIPTVFGSLAELEFLDLSTNKFVGSIPIEFGKLQNLKALNLSYNILVGGIPDELAALVELQDFQVSGNKLNGSIPKWVGNLTNLRVFAAYENDLGGEIPDSLGSVSELELLNLHSNSLDGSIPEGLFAKGKLEFLVLTQNRLTGTIPELIGSCDNLSSIRVGNNNLIGSIPKSVGNLTSLTYFEANNNNLSGEIVVEFARCSNLTLLNLASNGFTGIIPPELGQLSNLQELIVSENSLFGDIPESILRNRNLNKLDLSNNKFNGTIPADLCNTSRLQFLLLSQNSMRGEIPHEIGNCVKLLDLQLATNYLTGTIPPDIGRLKNLQISLNLSFNHLHGPLPPELGKLDKLVSLDVSNNRLSGSIPSALKGMLSLIEVNFSNNLFTGPIPAFVPFQKSLNSSFSGNKALCGQPLSLSCDNGGDQDNYTHKISYRIVLAVIGSGLAVFISVAVVVLLFMMREKQENSAKDIGIVDDSATSKPLITAGNIFVENFRQAIDFDAVVKATFKDTNKLSSGTFSTVYKATMPSGIILLVRSLKSVDKTIIHHQNKMIRELERLGRLNHDHLMRPLGFVIYEDVALLLHEYMSNGTLFQLLHENTKKPEYEPDWLTRLSIAIGIAEGLAFLHSVAVIHLDISSGNILLDANMSPRVAEIEISKLLDPSRGTASISAVAGSFGYIPPEYAYTMQVTAPGNVYSYGVILLEILTTHLPVEEAFGEGADLVKWVQSAPMRGETPEQILDARLSTVSFAWRKEMLAALKVALQCTDTTPAKRPKMKKVIEMLQEVKEK
ncbi:leucine-rich repeat receptor-like tyrosine-protein kinase PXC3 [Chenopodium quinoa]|uniref:leucine-rich repeat receptor-like tyrosine-protein kinase PXC3 n=1 Tax=Chenopodium quinoa TaxID=63459 RepID=UPI000B779C29|nr:leucine-rich repeat receptor-like tyrosine-protein kinase PXC3 [Chenopodium quinoa]